jgi:hypothetical protein
MVDTYWYTDILTAALRTEVGVTVKDAVWQDASEVNVILGRR